jgi:asparagine synthase (glutamine-hydrolysing)
MSAICGIINWNGVPVETDEIRQMAHAVAHRGPDGIHFWHGAVAALGHLALNVAPESPQERQPLLAPQADLVLVADARVDNRGDLIRFLSGKGLLPDANPTDAELLLAAYRYWDVEAPAHIIGDFAFAIWDVPHRRLFAARDPLGMRALYYRSEPQRLLFATEVKQILAAPDVPIRLFEPAVGTHLAAYFDWQEWTFYEGIKQLEPGHALLIDSAGQRIWRTWDVDFHHRIRYRDEREYAEHLLELLQEAVRCRLRTSWPAALLLSGGLDSASIASVYGWMKKRGRLEHNPALHTCSWAFNKFPQCDERHISDIIVRHYELPATYVPAEAEYPLKDYPEPGPDRDDPFDGPFRPLIESALKLARQENARTLLLGGRGDLVMGMSLFDFLGLFLNGHWHKLIHDWQELKRLSQKPTYRLIRKYLQTPLLYGLWPPGQARPLRDGLRALLKRTEPRLAYPDWVQTEFAARIGLQSLNLRPSSPQPLRNLVRKERYDAIFSAINMRSSVWADRMAARHGMQIADPWSDRRIVSFCMAVPQHLLNRPNDEKRLVRQAMLGVMPEDARLAARKILPFPLYEEALRVLAHDQVRELLLNPQAAARGYIVSEALTAYFDSYKSGAAAKPHFWYALTLEAWLRKYWQ